MAAGLVNVLGMLGLASRAPARQERDRWESDHARLAERGGAASHWPNPDASTPSPDAWGLWAAAATPSDTPPKSRKALLVLASVSLVLLGAFLARASDDVGSAGSYDQRVDGAGEHRIDAVEAELNELRRQQQQTDLEWQREQQRIDQQRRWDEQQRLQCEAVLAWYHSMGNYNVVPPSCR